MKTFSVLSVLFCSSAVLALPTGAPICKVNGTLIQSGMGPSKDATLGFKITPDSMTFSAGSPLTFTLDSTSVKSFKGVLLYVNSPDKLLLRSGSFDIPSGFKPGACDSTAAAKFLNDDASSTITHNSPADKTLPFKFSWTPGKSSQGSLTIRTAVALGQNDWQVLDPVALSDGSSSSSSSNITSSISSMSSSSSTGWKKCIVAPGSSSSSSSLSDSTAMNSPSSSMSDSAAMNSPSSSMSDSAAMNSSSSSMSDSAATNSSSSSSKKSSKSSKSGKSSKKGSSAAASSSSSSP